MDSKKTYDYSDEVHIVKSPMKRMLYLVAGWISLILGIIGLLLPIVPTTPFLLVSAACWAKSSSRFYNWLMNNPWFGSHLRRWRKYRCIPLRIKIIAVTVLSVTLGSSILLFVPFLSMQILLAFIGLGVMIYIARFPSTVPGMDDEYDIPAKAGPGKESYEN